MGSVRRARQDHAECVGHGHGRDPVPSDLATKKAAETQGQVPPRFDRVVDDAAAERPRHAEDVDADRLSGATRHVTGANLHVFGPVDEDSGIARIVHLKGFQPNPRARRPRAVEDTVGAAREPPVANRDIGHARVHLDER